MFFENLTHSLQKYINPKKNLGAVPSKKLQGQIFDRPRFPNKNHQEKLLKYVVFEVFERVHAFTPTASVGPQDLTRAFQENM